MTIIDISRIRGNGGTFFATGGKWEEEGERVENGRFAVLRIDTFFFFFFFFFFSPSLFAILLVSEAIHARMVTNEWSGGVKVEKVQAAMRSVEMIRTVEQVGAPLKYLLEIDYRGCRMPRYGDD